MESKAVFFRGSTIFFVGSNQQKRKKLEKWVFNKNPWGCWYIVVKKHACFSNSILAVYFARHNKKRVNFDRLVPRGDTFFFWDAFFSGGVFGRFHIFGSDVFFG